MVPGKTRGTERYLYALQGSSDGSTPNGSGIIPISGGVCISIRGPAAGAAAARAG